MARSGSRRLRPVARILTVLGVVAVLIVAWVALCVDVVAHPRTDTAAPVDAIVVLGPPDVDGRLETAQRLAAQGLTRTVVVSVNNRYQKAAVRFCRATHPGLTVYCFTPSPGTTRGEAEHVRELARAHGWTRLAVVTSSYHVSRARMIFDRCLDGTVLMLPAATHPSFGTWAYQFLYQSAGWVKAQFLRSC